MNEAEYLNLAKRETAADVKAFGFERIRGENTVVFTPGSDAKLHFENRGVDTLEFGDVPVGFFATGDTVVVKWGETIVFRGTLSKRSHVVGGGDTESESVIFAGPWQKMQNLVYRQYWATGNEPALSSHLILNQHSDGSEQNLASELSSILAHGATACGYQVGAIDVKDIKLPFDECRDITIADAVNRELRLFPRLIVKFDYSAATPKIIISRATETAADAAYIANIPKTQRVKEYNPNPITGVDLEVETVADGYRNSAHQRAGDTSTGNVNCLYATIQLQGATGSTVTQSLDVETEDLGDITDYNWWLMKHPRLATYQAGEVRISDVTRSGSADAKDYPRIAKTSAGELKAAGIKCRVEQFKCKASITTPGDVEEDVYLTMSFLMTNAKTKTYTWTVSATATEGESIPVGLAQAILDDRSQELQAERMTVRLGDNLPQIGDVCDGLILQSYDIDCANLTAQLNFGQPEHLTPDDMAALLSGFRNKRRATSSYSRASGKPEDDNNDEVEVGGVPPLASSEWSPGQKSKTTIKSNTENSGGAIVLDASELDNSETVGVHTLTIKGTSASTDSGVSTAAETTSSDIVMKVLATKDIEINPASGSEVNNGVLLIYYGNTLKGSFTANQSDKTTIKIPEAPSVYDGKLTIKYGSKSLGTFTANTPYDKTITIPEKSVNDATLTIKCGSETLGTFTANQNSDVTITIPASAGGGISGIYNAINIVTGVSWDTSTHRLVIAKKTFVFNNGVLTSCTDTLSDTIDTVPHSTVVGA